MPRKSAASLSLVSRLPGSERLAPPSELTKTEQDIWRGITHAMPANWFGPESEALLVGYVIQIATMREIAKRLRLIRDGSGSNDDLVKLTALFNKHNKAVGDSAQKLRLTPKSRYRPEVAENAIKAVPKRNPWDL